MQAEKKPQTISACPWYHDSHLNGNVCSSPVWNHLCDTFCQHNTMRYWPLFWHALLPELLEMTYSFFTFTLLNFTCCACSEELSFPHRSSKSSAAAACSSFSESTYWKRDIISTWKPGKSNTECVTTVRVLLWSWKNTWLSCTLIILYKVCDMWGHQRRFIGSWLLGFLVGLLKFQMASATKEHTEKKQS